MHASLLTYFRRIGIKRDVLQTVLPLLIQDMQEDFCTFADCGAGVGHKAKQLLTMLKSGLRDENRHLAKLYAYEPLPENITAIKQYLRDEPAVALRPVAVSNFNGNATFTIPWRCSGEGSWSSGTSYAGFLGSRLKGESVPVDVVRLDSENVAKLDFVKLDLQGGELHALQGLGKQLDKVKIVYAEHQFLRNPESQSLNFLTKNNYISYFDRVQIGIRKDLNKWPISELQEAGVVIEDAVVEKEVRMGVTLYGYIDSHRGPHLRLDGNYTTEFVDRLIAAGVSYFQTDLFAVNGTFLSAWQHIFSSSRL